MKKFLYAIILCPIFAFCSYEGPISVPMHEVPYNSYDDKAITMDTEPFWHDMLEDDYKLADYHLSKMEPNNFNEKVYMRLCQLYKAYREGNQVEMAIADMNLQEEIDNYLYE